MKENNDFNKKTKRFLSDEAQRILPDTPLSPIRVTTDVTGLNSGNITEI